MSQVVLVGNLKGEWSPWNSEGCRAFNDRKIGSVDYFIADLSTFNFYYWTNSLNFISILNKAPCVSFTHIKIHLFYDSDNITAFIPFVSSFGLTTYLFTLISFAHI